MLVRTNAAICHSDGDQLHALAGGQLLSSEFKYRRGMEIFGEGEEADYAYPPPSALEARSLLRSARQDARNPIDVMPPAGRA